MKVLGLVSSLALSGCALQLAEPLVSSPTPATDSQAHPSNDLENYLVITRVSAYPAVLTTNQPSVLTVEFQENLGRPVSASWFCDKGTLTSDKGTRTVWRAPDTPGVCECEATVKSKSGLVRGTLRIVVEN